MSKSTQRKKELELELDRIKKEIVFKLCPNKIILFGSLVGGKIEEWSDIDLVVVMDTNKRVYDRIGEVLAATNPKVAVEFIVYTPQEFEMLKDSEMFVKEEILEKGKILYEAA